MDRLTVGGATLFRIEETVDTSVTAEGFFPAFDLQALGSRLHWLAPRHDIAERGALAFSIYSQPVKTMLARPAFATPAGGRVFRSGRSMLCWPNSAFATS